MKDVTYCIVTHPDKPNLDGHARGRSVHIVNPDQPNKSICNMLVTYIPVEKHEVWNLLNRKQCKICFKDK